MLTGKRFEELRVADVHDSISKRPPTVQKSATVGDAIDAMLTNPLSRKVYVIDVEGNLVGVVTSETVLKLVGYRVGVRENSARAFLGLLRDTLKEGVEQVMQKAKAVKESSPLKEALYLMLENRLTDVPVVDDDHKLMGELISLELFEAVKDLFPRSEA